MKKLLAALIVISTIVLNISIASAYTPPPFSDHIGHTWENGIDFVYNRGIVQGYPDGTYLPNKTLNRAELLKVIVAANNSESAYNAYEGATCFDDMDGSQWYTKYVCFGKAQGIVEGYEDGTFRPEQEVNFVEALKIMLVGMNINLTSSNASPWYMQYYETADAKYLVPGELANDYTSDFSRAQAAEVIKRMISLNADIVQPPLYESEGGYEPGTVYLGYIQEGDTVDLYLVADTNISSYAINNVTFVFDSEPVQFKPDYQVSHYLSGNEISVSHNYSIEAGEIWHAGTAILSNSNSVTISTQ